MRMSMRWFSHGHFRCIVQMEIGFLRSHCHVLEDALVVDDLLGEFSASFVDFVERHYLRGVDYCHVESGFDSEMEEDGVQHVARVRVEAERDIRYAENSSAFGMRLLYHANRFDGFDACFAEFVVAGAERECESVEDNIFFPHAVFVD